jgi:nitrogen fixation protein NifU and related proteins
MDYHDQILDHYKFPRNEGCLKNPDIEIVETNASCGDTIKLQLKFDQNKKLKDIKYLCNGCAISKASSSMVSELVKGKTLSEIKKLNQKDIEKIFGSPISLGRIKCATLGLKALQKGLNKYTNKSMVKTSIKSKTKLLITKNLNLGELMMNFPDEAEILVNDYGLHCVGCMAASFETLEEGLKGHGYTNKQIDQIVKKLQKTK